MSVNTTLTSIDVYSKEKAGKTYQGAQTGYSECSTIGWITLFCSMPTKLI